MSKKNDNPFRDVNGRWITQGLFPETATTDKFLKYRLKDGISDKHKNLPVLKDLYMDMMDQTEYLFAQKYMGGWEHWQRCCDNALIGREIEKWREELEVKLVALGLMQHVVIARDTDDKRSLQAARYLADKGFKPKKAAGRPSKAEKAAEAELEGRVADAVSSDLERIRNLQ